MLYKSREQKELESLDSTDAEIELMRHSGRNPLIDMDTEGLTTVSVKTNATAEALQRRLPSPLCMSKSMNANGFSKAKWVLPISTEG
mmetsp:Transcript_49976/g.98475  ORF Transcript_49976/g.98475 Transcript_49976/m.98475 type:complete len:87 (+) Transcript_49976:192-452(+)